MERRQTRKFEIPFVILLIAILASVLLGALEKIQAQFEEAAVQSEISALRVELLDVLSHQQLVGGALPKSNNPVRWVHREPANYLGEMTKAPDARGVWYFDSHDDCLVYLFRHGGRIKLRLVRGEESRQIAGRFAGVGLQRINE